MVQGHFAQDMVMMEWVWRSCSFVGAAAAAAVVVVVLVVGVSGIGVEWSACGLLVMNLSY